MTNRVITKLTTNLTTKLTASVVTSVLGVAISIARAVGPLEKGAGFGVSGTQLFIQLDQLCRQVSNRALSLLGWPAERLGQILDPVCGGGLAGTDTETGTGKAGHRDGRDGRDGRGGAGGVGVGAGWDVVRSEASVHTSYLPPNFVSSSIMDNFHYRSWPHQDDDKNHKDCKHGQDLDSESKHSTCQFFNNHASHTDSGLLTAVVTTDEPALEVYDRKLKR